MKRFFPLLVVSALAAHLSHRALDTIELPTPDDPHETLPSIEALRLMSLGYGELLADYYWLRAISHYGDKKMHGHLYPNLEPLIRRVVTLDPYFASGYIFAGTALTTNEMDPAPAIELLKRGMEYRADVWRIPFLLGFNAYYFLGDYHTASEALGVAARLEGSPPFTGPLAARLAVEAGEPEIGIKLVETILEDIQDPKLQEEYIERRKLLILEWQIQQLDERLATYELRAGKRATDFRELIEAGLITAAPVDPLGGAYFIGENGRTATAHEARRLRLAPEAKRR